MSEYGATVAWHLKPGASFDYEHFNRGHEWTFAGGEVVSILLTFLLLVLVADQISLQLRRRLA